MLSRANTGLDSRGCCHRICSCTDTRPVTYKFCALLNNLAELAARELERDALIHTGQDSMPAVPVTSARCSSWPMATPNHGNGNRFAISQA